MAGDGLQDELGRRLLGEAVTVEETSHQESSIHIRSPWSKTRNPGTEATEGCCLRKHLTSVGGGALRLEHAPPELTLCLLAVFITQKKINPEQHQKALST